jgi:hypothetical protein
VNSLLWSLLKQELKMPRFTTTRPESPQSVTVNISPCYKDADIQINGNLYVWVCAATGKLAMHMAERRLLEA